ncbi:putative ribonuclease H-like domain-containing protein [Tanacetum coccineum]
MLLQSCPFSNKNGNSFKPTTQTTANADGTSTSMIPGPVTTEEKAQRKNDIVLANISEASCQHFFGKSTNVVSLVSLLSMEQEGISREQEWRGPRNQDNRNMNQDSLRRTVNMEETSSKAMVAIHGAGFKWSFMADEEVPTNMALMAFSDSEIKIDKFENASKSLDKFIGSQISNNSRKGVGFVSYNVVPPPPTGLFAPPTIDLSNSGLEEFQQPEFKGYGPKAINTAKEKVYTAKPKAVNTARPTSSVVNVVSENQGHLQKEDQGYVDSGCSRHMTNNMSYLSDFKEFDGGYATFGGGGRITFKGTLKTSKLDFEDVYFVKELYRFTWVFFLASKDDTSGILKNFITKIENLVDKKVKIIRCDNGTEFKNRVMNEFCEKKGIKREFSGKAVNIGCYVQNRVIIAKPHNKTPYELFRGRTPALSFMIPFRCHVTILNTLDHLGKSDGKSDDGFFVGYSLTSKAFRVYNIRNRKVEENLHIMFLKNKPIVTGDGPKWLFDIDNLTKLMNYVPVVVGTNSNDFACLEESNGASHTSKETGSNHNLLVMLKRRMMEV